MADTASKVLEREMLTGMMSIGMEINAPMSVENPSHEDVTMAQLKIILIQRGLMAQRALKSPTSEILNSYSESLHEYNKLICKILVMPPVEKLNY